MKLTLSIETSSSDYGVALSAGHDLIRHQTVSRTTPGFVNIGELAAASLREAGHGFEDLECLAVNVGPGNLGSVRAGVSYANGLAFSLHIPVLGVDSLTLTALEAGRHGGSAVLCVRNAGGGNIYAGLFREGGAVLLRHGPLSAVVPLLAGQLSEVSIAGVFRQQVANLLPDVSVKDTGIEFPSVLTLREVALAKWHDPNAWADFVSPLTDASTAFQ